MPSFHSWLCETLIGSTDPGQVTERLTTAFIAFIAIQVLTVVIPANYGRYADAKSAISGGMRFSTRNVTCVSEIQNPLSLIQHQQCMCPLRRDDIVC